MPCIASRPWSILGCTAILVVAACGGSQAQPAMPAASPAAAVAPSPASPDQVTTGKQLYVQNCASCHGAAGQGNGKAPPVVGKDALPLNPPATAKFRKTQFHTIKDIFEFVHVNMPPTAPGSLSDDQYWAILAFDLKANGVDLGGKRLDRSSAPGVVLHP